MLRSWKALIVASVLTVVAAREVASEQGFFDRKADETGRWVEVYLVKLRSQGEPTTLEDLTPEPIPPEENAATVYRQASEMYVQPETTEMALFGSMQPVVPEADPERRRWLHQNEGALALVRKAVTRERCQFVERYTGLNQGLPHLHMYRRFAVLLSKSIECHVEDGRIDSAVDECLVQLRLADHLSEGKTFIDYLVHISVVGMAYYSLEKVLGNPRTGKSDLEPMGRCVQRMLARQRFAQALRCERVLWFDQLNRPETWEDVGEEHVKAIKTHGVMRIWMNNEKLRCLQTIGTLIGLAQKPWYEIPEEQREPGPLFDELVKDCLPLTAMAVPALFRGLQQDIRRRTMLGLMGLGIELEEHRRASGSYPATLEELELRYFGELPVDPFTGRAFRYVKKPEGYLLYSVGLDGKDHGGRPKPGQDAVVYNEETDKWADIDDIGWRVGGEEEKPADNVEGNEAPQGVD